MAFFDTTWYVNFGNGTSTGYYAVPLHAANTTYVAGQIVRQFTTPAVGNERCFVCIVAGTSAAATDATWVLTRGAKTTDGTCTWIECTGATSMNGDQANTQSWAQVKATGSNVTIGQIIKRNSGASYQVCTLSSGALGATEPAFSDVAGTTTVDGSATWTSLGPVGNFIGGGAPHAKFANVLVGGWFVSPNTVYIASNHAETQAAGMSLSISGAGGTMSKFICNNYAGSYPPAGSDIITGATISVTGGTNSITISFPGQQYFYGLAFSSAAGSISLGSGSVTTNWYTFENCSFSVSTFLLIGSTTTTYHVIVFNNVTVKFLTTSSTININYVNFIWQNTGPILAAGSAVPATLIQTITTGRYANILLKNLDLSQLTGRLFSQVSFSTIGTVLVQDCKLGSALLAPILVNAGMRVEYVRSDSVGTSYKSSRFLFEGTETTETTGFRTGGAVDPAGQKQSRKIYTSSSVDWLRPYKAEPLAIWCPPVITSPPTNATLDGVPANTTISNGGLTATHTSTASNSGARSAITRSSGKYYFEVTIGPQHGNNDAIGLLLSTGTYTDLETTATNMVATYIAQSNGWIWTNGGNSTKDLGGTATTGDVIGIATDLDLRVAWFRKNNGNWNGLAGYSPITGVGGVNIMAGSLGPVVGFGGSGSAVNDSYTVNFGQSAYANPAPGGFGNWATLPTIAPVTVTVCGTMQSSTIPYNDEIWMEVEYLADASSTLGTIVSTTKSNLLAGGSPVAVDSSVWVQPVPPADPYITNVKLLLGFTGADGATGAPGMTDESSAVHGTASVNSGAKISSTQSVFGGTSLYCNGFDGIGFPDHTDWDLSSGSFTIELRIFSLNVTNSSFFVGQWGTTGILGWQLWQSGSKLTFNVSTTGSDNITLMTSSTTLVNSTWYAVCVEYDGTKYRMYIDGVMVASSTTPRTIFNSSHRLWFGASDVSSFYYIGYMDEVRLTKGVARYASDSGYTIATAAFPRPGSLLRSEQPAPQTTLITLDGTPNNVTMSNGNLTMTRNSTAAGGVTSTDFLTDGQVYFEVTLLTSLSNSNSFGLISSGDPVTTPPGVGIAQKVAVLLGTSSSIIYTNKFVGGNTGIDLGPAVVGDVWGMAADIYFGRCWFRKNGGLWNGSGSANPATGSGGIDFDVRPGKAPYGGFAAGSNSTDVMKFNFGQGAFGSAPPPDFGPPDGSGGSVGGWYTFKLVATVTPALAGYLHARIRAAKPSTTYYIDPQITLVVPVVVYATLDGPPSAGIIMSNGNLTATRNTAGTAAGVDSLHFLSSGKYYFEVTISGTGFGSNALGIIKSTGTYLDIQGGGANGVFVVGSGNINSNGANVASISGHSTGRVYGIAVDLTAGNAWFRDSAAGNWNGNSSYSPATGVGGAPIPAGSWSPFVMFQLFANSTDAFTANFGQSAFSGAVPSGFTSGWPG